MYEFDARRGAMLGMGWASSFTVAGQSLTPDEVACRNSFTSDGHKVCAPVSERDFMAKQGCLNLDANVCFSQDIDTAHGGGTGEQYCCPPGRPGTATSGRVAYTSSDIYSLQSAINLAGGGCSSGTVDGDYGTNTQRGLQCWANRVGWPVIVAQFPFVSTLISDVPSTVSEGTSSVPVTSTPSATPSTPVRTAADQQRATNTKETPFYDQWYFRAGVAAVAAIGVVGILYYQIHKRVPEDSGEIDVDFDNDEDFTDTIPDTDYPRKTRPGYRVL